MTTEGAVRPPSAVGPGSPPGGRDLPAPPELVRECPVAARNGRLMTALVRYWRAWVVLAAVVLLVVPVPQDVVDRLFGRAFYPLSQPVLTGLSNRIPVALLDVAVLGLLACLVAGGFHAAKAPGRRRAAAFRFLANLVTVAACVYILFLGTWGLNYGRTPLTARLEFDASRVGAESVIELARGTAAELNALRPSGIRALPDAALAPAELEPGFSFGLRVLGLPAGTVPGRPKWSLLDLYFTRSGVSGMTDPFFLETLVAGNLLPFERPAVIAHEWGHLAGLARESEASFFGWLVCRKSPPAARYSGQLELFLRSVAALEPRERSATLALLTPEVQADIRAISERNRKDQVRVVSVAAWRTYDKFLRANRVASGVKNYDEVVALVVGTRFTADGAPILRGVSR
jgi:hypothetical protein